MKIRFDFRYNGVGTLRSDTCDEYVDVVASIFEKLKMCSTNYCVYDGIMNDLVEDLVMWLTEPKPWVGRTFEFRHSDEGLRQSILFKLSFS